MANTTKIVYIKPANVTVEGVTTYKTAKEIYTLLVQNGSIIVEGVTRTYDANVEYLVQEDESEFSTTGKYPGVTVGTSLATKAIETTDNVTVEDTAIITTTGGTKDINPSETGFTAYLIEVDGASNVSADFKYPTLTNNYTPAEGTEYDFSATITDPNLFTSKMIAGTITAGTSISLVTIQSYTDYGVTVTGTPAGTETFTITAPVYQTVEFPTITTFNSTSWNLMDSNNQAHVIEGQRYQLFSSGSAPTATIGSTAQTIDTTYVCSRGHAVPYSFVATATGLATLTNTTVCALIWSGKYCERTTNTTYNLSTISIPASYQTLRGIGTTYDSLNAYQHIQRIFTLTTTEANFMATVGKARIITSSNIYYADTPVITTFETPLEWNFTANDMGELYWTYSGTEIPVTFVCTYGASLVDKLARDVLTISAQTLTSTEQAQVHENLGIVPMIVTYSDGTSATLNIVSDFD